MIKPRMKNEYLISQEIISSEPLFNVISKEKIKKQTTTDDNNVVEVATLGIAQ